MATEFQVVELERNGGISVRQIEGRQEADGSGFYLSHPTKHTQMSDVMYTCAPISF